MSSEEDSRAQPLVPETAIALDDVVKSYGPKTAVAGITLQVRRGEVFAFLGPNGAGKTTTIKMIVGLLNADQGSVAVCGHLMGSNGLAAKARLAYVPDQPFVYDKLTGRGAEISYAFDDFELHIPSSASSNAEHACWKMNGTLKISTRSESGE